MCRVVTSTFAALTLLSSIASAQQPCTTDSARVVAEVYRHTLERAVDAGAQGWQQQLTNGQITVRELVRRVAKSPEYMNRFGRTEAGEGQPYERAVARLYRHVLARQPDPAGQRSWAINAQQNGLSAVVDRFVDSTEYTNNFGDWAVPGSGGMRFCAPGSQSSQSRSSNRNMDTRFRGMDRNDDGVISRPEWRGNTIAFNNQDRNNDGVLSGEEVRAGRRTVEDEDSDRRDEFANLDVNRNNRIEEQEWHASLDAFRRLDRNRDRVVSHAEYHANDSPNTVASEYDFDRLDVNRDNRIGRREWQARLDQFNALDRNSDNFLSRAEVEGTATDQVGTSGGIVIVGGDRTSVDTGIDVRAGDTLTIRADGQIRLSRNTRDTATAAGSTTGRRASEAPIPNAPAGSLIGRIGNSAPFVVGDNRTMRAPRAGRLYLGINDDYFDDNTGQYRVTVDIR
jgi:hypothetical protein